MHVSVIQVGLTELRDFFLKAMVQGWASGIQGKPKVDGYKEFFYVQREMGATPLSLSDRWCGSGGAYAGAITICFEHYPVWVMQYMGDMALENKDEITSFLQRTLLKTYKSQLFIGGRGFNSFDDSGFHYSNNCPASAEIGEFTGEEIISHFDNGENEIVAECRFQGGVVAPLLVTLD